MLPVTQFAYMKGLGTCDALLCVLNTLQSDMVMGQEARMAAVTMSTIRGFSQVPLRESWSVCAKMYRLGGELNSVVC